MAELKPCPFCGGEAKIMGDEDYFWGECLELECVAQTRGSKSREKAIAQWNRRTEPQKLFDAVEVVRCANCLWFDMTGYEEDNQDIEPYLQTGFCGIWGKDAQMCDFCSYGERRAEDG